MASPRAAPKSTPPASEATPAGPGIASQTAPAPPAGQPAGDQAPPLTIAAKAPPPSGNWVATTMAPQAARPLLPNQSRALHGPVATRGAGLGRDHSHQRLLVQGALRLAMLPTARACPVCGQAWLQSIWGGARCYPPYDATPQEGQEDEAGHHSPQGDEASEASEDHLAQFAAVFQVFEEGQENSNQEAARTPTRRARLQPGGPGGLQSAAVHKLTKRTFLGIFSCVFLFM